MHLSFVFPYYKNPEMLRMHCDIWKRYVPALECDWEVVLVDDGSPDDQARDIMYEYRHDFPQTMAKIDIDIPWNQHCARNRGAELARGKWLWVSDMDCLLHVKMADRLTRITDEGRYHTVERKTLEPDGSISDMHYHCNSFLVTKAAYEAVGGYDELFCGTYGGDGPFHRALDSEAPRQHHEDIFLVRVPRETLADASTTDFDRTGWFKTEYRRRMKQKNKKTKGAYRPERTTTEARMLWQT